MAELVESMVVSFLNYASAAVDREEPARRELWQREHRTAHEGLWDFCAGVRGDDGDRGTTGGTCLAAWAGAAPDAERLVLSLVGDVERLLPDLGLPAGEPLPVVVLAGTTRADGWVETYQGRPTLFVELTKLPTTPAYARVLVAHEAMHVVHARERGPWTETVGHEVFAEGLATWLSRLIVPRLSELAYLWFDERRTTWLADCVRQEADIARAVLDVVYEPERTHGRRFLSAAAGSGRGLPERCGYFLGLHVLDRLAATLPAPATPLSWNEGTVGRQVASVLQSVGERAG